METRVLRYFLETAREGNITRAAEKLHITQPSLSRQLMELEKEVGKALLIRGKRKVTLTEDGLFLQKRAEEILSLLDKTEEELRSDEKDIRGQVAIGGNPLPSIIQTASLLRKEYPGINFFFYSSDATDVMERLDRGSLSFAVLLEPVDLLKYESFSLPDTSRWGLLLSSHSPLAEKKWIAPEDIRTVPLILHHRKGLKREVTRWAGVELTDLEPAAEYNVIHGDPSRLVQCGLGTVLTVEDNLPEVLPESVCFRPLYPTLETHVALVWKRYPLFTKAEKLFLEKLKSFCSKT